MPASSPAIQGGHAPFVVSCLLATEPPLVASPTRPRPASVDGWVGRQGCGVPSPRARAGAAISSLTVPPTPACALPRRILPLYADIDTNKACGLGLGDRIGSRGTSHWCRGGGSEQHSCLWGGDSEAAGLKVQDDEQQQWWRRRRPWFRHGPGVPDVPLGSIVIHDNAGCCQQEHGEPCRLSLPIFYEFGDWIKEQSFPFAD